MIVMEGERGMRGLVILRIVTWGKSPSFGVFVAFGWTGYAQRGGDLGDRGVFSREGRCDFVTGELVLLVSLYRI